MDKRGEFFPIPTFACQSSKIAIGNVIAACKSC